MVEKRIVVGVDGSDSSLDALRWAAEQARLTGAGLEVIMAWEYPPSFGWAPPLPADWSPGEEARRELADSVERALGATPPIEVRQVVVQGHPAPALVAAAREADLLVVGSRGHGAFVGMLLGSVSEHCVSHAPCPVVVVRG
jgi:nucleotide-binding universal stress UspA family protein